MAAKKPVAVKKTTMVKPKTAAPRKAGKVEKDDATNFYSADQLVNILAPKKKK